jgi:hypothetical protein
MCSKRKHKSREKAERVLSSLKERKPKYWGKTYWCVQCQAWHYGRQAGKARYLKRKHRVPND